MPGCGRRGSAHRAAGASAAGSASSRQRALTTRAGTPAATTRAGSARVTTAPAPTTVSSSTSAITTAALPIQHPRPILDCRSLEPLVANGYLIVRAVHMRAARHVNASGQQHVVADVREAEMAARSDVHPFTQSSGRSRKQHPEFDRHRRVALVQHPTQKRAAKIHAGKAWNQRQELARPFECPLAAEEQRANPIGDEVWQNGQRRETERHLFECGPHRRYSASSS